jgi:hypothetical protein
MASEQVKNPAQHQVYRKKRPGPGQGADLAFRYSRDSSATILVSKGWKPVIMLAQDPPVLENGQADPGTGHRPTGKPGRFWFSITWFWSKFRPETQDSVRPIAAAIGLWPEIRQYNEKAKDMDTKALCI